MIRTWYFSSWRLYFGNIINTSIAENSFTSFAFLNIQWYFIANVALIISEFLFFKCFLGFFRVYDTAYHIAVEIEVVYVFLWYGSLRCKRLFHLRKRLFFICLLYYSLTLIYQLNFMKILCNSWDFLERRISFSH